MRPFLLRLILVSGMLFLLTACSGENKPSSQAPQGAKETGAGEMTDQVRWHQVRKGDTLSAIAEKYYGYAYLYFNIYEANREVLKDPDSLKIGQRLKVPPLKGWTSYVPPLH